MPVVTRAQAPTGSSGLSGAAIGQASANNQPGSATDALLIGSSDHDSDHSAFATPAKKRKRSGAQAKKPTKKKRKVDFRDGPVQSVSDLEEDTYANEREAEESDDDDGLWARRHKGPAKVGKASKDEVLKM